MDDGKHSVAVSDHRREFIEEEVAAGTYANEAEVVDAALELLERSKRVGALRALIAEADDQFERGDYSEFSESDDLTQYIVDNAESLRR
ncbi:MAG: type II toxin-antitoxin system ParD family antitoxin [Rhizobium sp.]|nr:type II toxin-antitoxin system ParD family antitoxin [Rhizobium sp.]